MYGRSAGHSVLKCWDPSWEEDGYFIAPERKGFPKIQPLGVRKLTPIAAELRDALEQLREFLDPDDVNCEVSPQLRKDATVQMYLSTWVEGPVARARAAIDPYWRASEQDREAAQ
ncbi:hypothetical protein JK364_23930 [Streptomyces sp. 110]|uniref:Uncharacterized protein n=1 Tax=Streptomyces endocoffeicus TaxID=2898945 RepID=A0ABS1PT04_9ACTN|nr:hypothetical protein [Streptomyces endocoffeicus]MBL1115424.1 hypothetical protein [Streptomyces endocoffeicus]